MKVIFVLLLLAAVSTICLGQAVNGGFGPPMGAGTPLTNPNFMRFLMLRNGLDMNFLPALWLSGQMGGAGGMMPGGSLMPYLMFGSK